MKQCWHSDPGKRPQATDIYNRFFKMPINEWRNRNSNPTVIIKSPDIGPVTANELIIQVSGVIYKSRSLSSIINSAMSLRSSISQSISLKKVKRKFEDNYDGIISYIY
jgi:hypothetical protein